MAESSRRRYTWDDDGKRQVEEWICSFPDNHMFTKADRENFLSGMPRQKPDDDQLKNKIKNFRQKKRSGHESHAASISPPQASPITAHIPLEAGISLHQSANLDGQNQYNSSTFVDNVDNDPSDYHSIGHDLGSQNFTFDGVDTDNTAWSSINHFDAAAPSGFLAHGVDQRRSETLTTPNPTSSGTSCTDIRQPSLQHLTLSTDTAQFSCQSPFFYDEVLSTDFTQPSLQTPLLSREVQQSSVSRPPKRPRSNASEPISEPPRNRLQPRSEPYDEVHVLLLGWEHDDDDKNHNREMRRGLEKLEAVLKGPFNYKTESHWKIPPHQPTTALNRHLLDFRAAYDRRRNLLVVYYAGHATRSSDSLSLLLLKGGPSVEGSDGNRAQLYRHERGGFPVVDWTLSQRVLLADIVADALIIMDCCNALEAFRLHRSIQPGTVGIWAACACDRETHVSGPACFTENLIAVLGGVKDKCCDVGQLNQSLIESIHSFLDVIPLSGFSIPRYEQLESLQANRKIRIKKMSKAQGDLSEVTATTTSQGAGLVVAIPNLPNNRDEAGEMFQGHRAFRGGSALDAMTLFSADTPDMIEQEIGKTLEAKKDITSVSAPTSHVDPMTHADGRFPQEDFVEDKGNGTGNVEGQIHQQQRGHILIPKSVTEGPDSDAEEQSEHVSPFPPVSSEEVHAITRNLAFHGGDSRKHSIGIAYPRTFQWITNHEGFVQWTQGSEPLFCFYGKPGSGKSTMMKYLLHYCGSQRMFPNWRDGSQILTASFFFWAAGTPLGRSCEGCLRSLLVQIMDQDPDTTAYAVRFLHRHGFGNTQYSLHELQMLLKALMQDESSPMRTKSWCIFLDGLDECDDWDGICKIILHVLRGPHIKVCISSRPPMTILESFEDTPHLRMQSFTGHDIYTFVLGQLRKSHERDSYDHVQLWQLGIEIAREAEGVFLWAALTTQKVLDSLSNGGSWSEIRRALQEIPKDLLDLYNHLLHRLTPVAAMTLLVAQACEVDVLDIINGSTVQPVLTTTLLVFALENSKKDALSAPIQPLDMTEMSQGADRISNVIRQETYGLVTIDKHVSDNGAATISYMHKTAYDFLTDFDVMRRLRESSLAPQFIPHLALLRAVVLDVKTQDLEKFVPFTDMSIDNLLSLPFWTKIEQAIRYAQIVFGDTEADHVGEVVELLDELDRVLQIQLKAWSKNSLLEHWSSLMPLGAAVQGANHNDNFLSYATSCGLWEYVSHKLEADTPLLKPGKPLLFYAIQPQPQFAGSPNNRETVRVLLERGAQPNDLFLGESAWSRFLKTFTLFDADHSHTEHMEHLREIFQLFLQYGADASAVDAVAVG